MDQPEQRYLIENSETGAQYAVLPEDYEREKDGAYAGYTVISWEDGTPIEEPAEESETDASPTKKKG